ncbi:single-stranded DNA-binding protein [Isoptericola jiangsuensis]|uniref:single-stranded DNA-binding protein n=1 Tax=Isoptericola jiangsuensis TaxID=548579 RepID=UPI003AAD35E7
MSEATVTVTGYVGTTPELHVSANKVPWTSFRVASTRRVKDTTSGEWRDGATTWFTVKAFRAAARSVCESLVQGQPVVLTGRLSTEEWTDREGRARYAFVVDADAVGPDATRGWTRFAKVRDDAAPRPAGAPEPSPWDTSSPRAEDGERTEDDQRGDDAFEAMTDPSVLTADGEVEDPVLVPAGG